MPAQDAIATDVDTTGEDGAVSHGQRALWFLHRLAPESSAYHITQAARIRGGIHPGTMERALQALPERHAALRSTFPTRDGGPVVRSVSRVPSLRVEDARAWSAEHLATRLREEARRPFDLEHGPLLRTALYERPADEWVLLMVVHHIVSDLPSMAVLVRDLVALYVADEAGEQAHLPPPVREYSDFVAWEASMLDGTHGARLWDYWRAQLEGELPPLELPGSRSRPPVQTHRGGSHAATIDRALAGRVKALAQKRGITAYTAYLAAFQALLHRCSGQTDILVGSPASRRTRGHWADVVGYFVNPLVMRARIEGDPPFLAFLDQVRDTVQDAVRHLHFPFPLLVERLRPPRDPSRSPIFQVMFVWQQIPLPSERFLGPFALGVEPARVGLGGREIEAVLVQDAEAQFDLTLSMMETDGGLSGVWQYNADLFEPSTIARLARHFRILLEGVVADPTRRLSALPLLTEAERAEVVVKWNATAADYPRDRCLHHLVEEQVARTPDAVAVRHGPTRWSYRELDRRANRLARLLRRRGVRPEMRVALCVDRSPHMIVGILGILKAGGAYVPLDLAYPDERLAFMLQDARIGALVTQGGVCDRLPRTGVPVIRLDADQEELAREAPESPRVAVRPHQLAYVIYTSGSTGRPKGVLIEHRNAVNFVCWARSAFPPADLAGVLAATSLCFDLSVFELFAPLSSGGSVVLVQDVIALRDLTAADEVTLVNTVPSAMAALLRSGDLPASVRTVNLAGERLDDGLRQQVYAQPMVERLFNLYGPTETTTYSTFTLIERGGGAVPAIGRPIANTQVYLLDAHGEPVPVGVLGELYIGGDGVARGYLNRTEDTAAKFISDPFTARPGARLYRTGDRARYRADGSLEFIGRLDGQVKVRGFRVELGEIEAVLLQHPAVREAVVVARENGGRNASLVAYVMPGGGENTSRRTLPRALRAFLREKLPAHMIPGAVVPLDAIPRTPNGKTDRQALPAPTVTAGGAPERPRTATERRVAAVWCQVLGLERIGLHEDFFEAGGDSLAAVQASCALSSATGREIPVRFILSHPSVASATAALRGPVGDRRPKSPPPAVCRRRKRFVTVEHRSLDALFEAGTIAPVEAAAAIYLPGLLLDLTGLGADRVIQEWFHSTALFAGVYETSYGRIAAVLVPRFDFQLYDDRAGLLHMLGDALALARRLGARTLSLTGLLPSATDYGRALAAAVCGQDLPAITTGHATTAAAVVLTIERALREASRDLTAERMGFIGLGSIGRSALRLLLHTLPHPGEILLCDLLAHRGLVDEVREEMAQLGYRGRVRCLPSRGQVPDDFYDATVILAATNLPDLLTLDRLAPGTIVIDESAPPCIDPSRAAARLRERGDLLVTGCGVLRAPRAIHQLRYFPPAVEAALGDWGPRLVPERDPREITGCIFSSLLSAKFPELPPTVGLVDTAACAAHHRALVQLGFGAARLHCADWVLPAKLVAAFRGRFGA